MTKVWFRDQPCHIPLQSNHLVYMENKILELFEEFYLDVGSAMRVQRVD